MPLLLHHFSLLLPFLLPPALAALNKPFCYLDPMMPALHLSHLNLPNDNGPALIPADCARAIAMIPSGAFKVDTRHTAPGRKLDLAFPPGSRSRKFFLPAAFRAGTCLVTVDASSTAKAQKHTAGALKPPASVKPAAEMYTTVWPNVKEQALAIVAECFERGEQKNAGTVASESWLGPQHEFYFPYYVTVSPAPRGVPGDGETMRLMRQGGTGYSWAVEYNVYEAGGRASGPGVRRARWQPVLRTTLRTA
jgi:hypothetical protein